MPKLFFRHAAMSSGKTAHLISVANNYEALGKRVLLLKPAIDTRSENIVESRLGITRKVDHLLYDDTIIQKEWLNGICCVLVDEVQFLSDLVVLQLRNLTIDPGIPVMCYGLRSTASLELFPGSAKLFAVADIIEELCHVLCGKCCKSRAIVNWRRGGPTQMIEIGGSDKYIPLCYKCYYQDPIQK